MIIASNRYICLHVFCGFCCRCGVEHLLNMRVFCGVCSAAVALNCYICFCVVCNSGVCSSCVGLRGFNYMWFVFSVQQLSCRILILLMCSAAVAQVLHLRVCV